jgi:predicted dinucleotide-binding enzyme
MNKEAVTKGDIVFLIIPYKFLSLDGRGLRACPEFVEG